MALNYPKIKMKLPGPKVKALIERDADFVSPSYTRGYPLVAERSCGCTIEDPDGNLFLDLTAGIAVTATGHCHPRVVEAITTQANKLIHMSGTDFYYAPQIDLAERLANVAPGNGPKRVFFCNSGAEAVEGAIKLARYFTGRQAIIGFFGAFHGRTLGALSLTASKAVQREQFFPLVPSIYHAPYPNPYRCPDGVTPEAYATQCVDWIRERLFGAILPPSEVAAVVVEPIQGEGGYIVPPANFHRELKALCTEHGILYIADEIQAGMGRTGKLFASEHFGVEPDVMTLAKGIASGMPLGAIVSRAEVMEWKPGAHASTFGGNPVSCAAALATLDLLEEGLVENAATQGDYFQSRLAELAQRYDKIGDVRGKGLMLCIELVEDRATKVRAPAVRNAIVDKAFYRGLLTLGCGSNSIRFSPALTITQEEIDVAIDILDAVLKEV